MNFLDLIKIVKAHVKELKLVVVSCGKSFVIIGERAYIASQAHNSRNCFYFVV